LAPELLMLPEDEFFELTANVTSAGPQSVVLKGYLVSERPDGTYVAPLLPQLFFGFDGTQLSTWRQNLTQTGEQVILSRSGGQPSVPREELWWRKVKPKTEVAEEVPTVVKPTFLDQFNALPLWQKLLIGAGVITAVAGAGYLIAKRK